MAIFGVPTDVFGGVLVVAGVVSLVIGSRWLQFAYRLDAKPVRSVDDVGDSPGPVTTAGVVTDGAEPFPSPLFGVDCYVCEYEIERFVNFSSPNYDPSESTGFWWTIDSGRRVTAFEISGERGRHTARVDPEGARLVVGDRSRVRQLGEPVGTHLRGVLEDHPDVDPPGGASKYGLITHHRYTERRLQAGDDCHVYGAAHVDDEAVRIDDDAGRKMLLTDGEREDLYGRYAVGGMALLLAGIGLLYVGQSLAL